MSFLKTVAAAHDRLRENATPCDNCDIATPDADPDAVTVAMSQKSQGGACAEPTEPVAVSQLSQAPAPGGLSAEDWVYLFHERAAVAEYDGGLDRAAAERQAFACVVAHWRSENGPTPTERTDPCVSCGQLMGDDAVPMLAKGGHAWRHHACWPAYDRTRQAEAEAAVRALLGGLL